ncbi:Mis12-domain-containing protein [Lactarius indigo]|nr:Mis12-domain-containing protein [Lactarius indigo]
MAAQQGTSSNATPTVLVPELLSFSPHFLLDDTINIANDGVGRAVDAMEDFLNRWAETRLEREPDWDADKELEQGLVSFQTLLEFHTDIAFDFFEAWSLRNIFAVPADLPLVAPHHAGLDFNQPPEKEAELLAEIDELWREIEKQKKVRLLLTKAKRASGRHAKRAQARLDRLAFLQPDQLRMLHSLATDVDALHASVSALPPLDPANTQSLLPAPGKREWEMGRAGYISWVNAQLLRHANAATGSAPKSASVEEAPGAISKEHLSAALRALEHDDS